MIMTITYKGNNTQDLGFLLYKNPGRPQSFDLSMGKAHVFYPELSDERTTAALVLELDPLLLSKGKPGTGESGLFDYVNDRPYVTSSFMCNALSRVFGTAMTGRCDQRQELADGELDLEIQLSMLPVHGEKGLLNRFFEPLGYGVSHETFPVDEDFPSWGESNYVNLTLSCKKKLSDVLNQIYVLIPVFDMQRHHYVTESEIDNLLKHGDGWLESHPEKEHIVRRYFYMARSYAKTALLRLNGENVNKTETGGESDDDDTGKQAPLDRLRLQAVKSEVLSSGSGSVIDIGCGEGKLLELLVSESQIERMAGADVSLSALKKAEQRIEHACIAERQREKVTFFQGSLMYRDSRFKGYDVVCVVEVIEHIDIEKLPILEGVLFGETAPRTVIVTTPNYAYNGNYGLANKELRHPDHRFEWDEETFRKWCGHICEEFGYTADVKGIGEKVGVAGFSTQMGVFHK